MPTAEELTLAIQAENVGETQDKLEGVEKSMEETAESAGDSAEQLEDFSKRFQGAMGAAIAALATAAVGLLSQVPVIGEVFSGFRAIIDQLILQIDKDLRPALSDLTDDLFEVAKKTGDADGTFEALATAIRGVNNAFDAAAVSTIQNEIKNLTGITIPKNWLDFGWEVFTMDAQGAVDAIKKSFKQLPNDLETLTGQPIREIFSGLATDAKSWGKNLFDNFRGGIRSRLSAVIDGFTSLGQGLMDWASSLADAAYDWGVGLIERFINGLKDTLSGAGDFLGEISAATGIDIPDVSATGTATVIGGAVGGGAGAALANTAAGAFARSGRSGDGGTTLDGRQLTESTGRYRSDPARRQGL